MGAGCSAWWIGLWFPSVLSRRAEGILCPPELPAQFHLRALQSAPPFVPHPLLQSLGGPAPANRSAIHCTAAGALLRAANPWFTVGMKTHWTLLPAAHSRFMYSRVTWGRTSSSAPPCAR